MRNFTADRDAGPRPAFEVWSVVMGLDVVFGLLPSVVLARPLFHRDRRHANAAFGLVAVALVGLLVLSATLRDEVSGETRFPEIVWVGTDI